MIRRKKLVITLLALSVTIIAVQALSDPKEAFFGRIDPSQMNPNKINTIGWEDSPFISSDDREFYFMYTPWNFFPLFVPSGGIPLKVGPDRPGHHTHETNPWEDSDIYLSTKQADGTWGLPINLSFNTDTADCCMMPTSDGKAIYFQKTVKEKPKDKGDIYVVRKDKDGRWGEAVNIGPKVNTEWQETNPHITPNEKSLYFMSDRPGSIKGKDLYVSRRQADGSWGEPKSLGPKINSGVEDQVWVNDDETEMYFGREGVPGLAYSKYVNGEWSEPTSVKFGTENIIGEISFSANGKKAYFAVVDFTKKDITMSFSEKNSDGTWSPPRPLD